MRALDNEASAPAWVGGFRIYYNFLRPHQGLNGKTPAQVAGLARDLGRNRWLSLIKESVRSLKLTGGDLNVKVRKS